MPLPGVRVTLNADGTGEVWLNDHKLPGVTGVQIVGVAGDLPRVMVTVRPGELIADLPETGVQLVTNAHGSASEFAGQLNPARLEAIALDGGDLDTTTGEAFTAAVAVLAAEYDQAQA